MEAILRKKLGARGVVDFQHLLEENGGATTVRVMMRLETHIITALHKTELEHAEFIVGSSSGNVISGSIHSDNLVKVASLIFVKKIDVGSALFQE